MTPCSSKQIQRQVIDMEPYSTLEVRQVENYEHHDRNESTKEAISQDAGIYEDTVPLGYDKNDKFPVLERGIVDNDVKEDRKNKLPRATLYSVCGLPGLSRTAFYVALAAVVLVVIGAIAGGVAGGVLSRRGDYGQNGAEESSSAPDNSSSPPKLPADNIHILATSRLASSNWTDAAGTAHRAVFFQDPKGAIIARRWDSLDRTWATRNVTDIINSGGATGSEPDIPAPAPILGTPLVSAAYFHNDTDSGLQLWYLSSVADGSNSDVVFISGARLPRPVENPEGWAAEETYKGHQVAVGSQLAAAWQRCGIGNCAGNWVLAFQTPEGDVNVANSSSWDSPARVIDAGDVV